MSISVLKTAALAAAVLVATTASSFAATWAYIDHDVLVRANHNNASPVINSADEGDYVKVLGSLGQLVQDQDRRPRWLGARQRPRFRRLRPEPRPEWPGQCPGLLLGPAGRLHLRQQLIAAPII